MENQLADAQGTWHRIGVDILQIFKSMTFDAAHRLPNVPEGHKCSRLHGHTFKVELYVSGPMDEKRGWVIDFTDIKSIFQPLIDQLDHNYLNDIPGLENPTSENIARWIWKHLKSDLPMLNKVIVYESPTSAAVYEGENL
jgi:6-pyruvoyltetrahydropterin/6-carboxytetrahydropterin synthase